MKTTLIAAAAVLTAASPSFAQDAAPPAQQAAPADATSFSDDDIQKFAMVMSDARPIFTDATKSNAEKEGQLIEVLKQRGLEPEKFNAIGQAADSDPAVREKVQAAMTGQQ